MVIVRRFGLKIADEIERLEGLVRLGMGPPRARQVYLAALMVCEDDGRFHPDEAVAVANWMEHLGRIEWERKDGSTEVRFRECLN